MRFRTAPALFAALSLLLLAAGCGSLGKYAVRVETGNQASGLLSRPLSLTTSSDESVQEVAQGICNNVKRGSVAQVSFVGKVPSPDPLDFSDWGRYHYDCVATAAPAARGTGAPAATAADASRHPVAVPAVAARDPQAAAPAEPAGDMAQQRACLRERGSYHVCLGNCMITSTSAPAAVPGECAQRCAPQGYSACP